MVSNLFVEILNNPAISFSLAWMILCSLFRILFSKKNMEVFDYFLLLMQPVIPICIGISILIGNADIPVSFSEIENGRFYFALLYFIIDSIAFLTILVIIKLAKEENELNLVSNQVYEVNRIELEQPTIFIEEIVICAKCRAELDTTNPDVYVNDLAGMMVCCVCYDEIEDFINNQYKKKGVQ